MDKLKNGVIVALLLAVPGSALARGVSPYLPLNLEPEMEAQIERVLILGDQPALTRPIPAAVVLEALPKARAIDPELAADVERYLRRFMYTAGIAHASVTGAASTGQGADTISPNSYGMRENSHWDVSGQA